MTISVPTEKGRAMGMFYCERCGEYDCCERLDLPTEPVLCDKCYEKALANGERREDNG